MQAFFESFGVNWHSLAFYVLLFGAVLFIVQRFLLKPMLGAIDRRQEEIERSLDDAEAAARSVKESQEKAEKILWDASSEAQDIIRNGEKIASDIQERARQTARAESDSMVAKARGEIDRERQAAIAEIRRQTVDLAIVAASRVVEQNLDSERNRELAEQAIRSAELGR
ncbi:MAG: F-type H+-transporting ATPase subunit b [Chloroflexota bacterium]|jgi:F-type H+-transporting ATPase subunit b|nr:F-type H+-transporting ATPase subunit b [Chloroflexota bacterium]